MKEHEIKWKKHENQMEEYEIKWKNMKEDEINHTLTFNFNVVCNLSCYLSWLPEVTFGLETSKICWVMTHKDYYIWCYCYKNAKDYWWV